MTRRNIIVTSGIGASALCAGGYSVLVTGRRAERLTDLARETGCATLAAAAPLGRFLDVPRPGTGFELCALAR